MSASVPKPGISGYGESEARAGNKVKKGNYMYRKKIYRMGIAQLLLSACLAQASPVAPSAERIVQKIDALDVEHHWPAGEHVKWETGVPDGRPESGTGKHTHCSAFVAAAAKNLGIYILRPPEHKQILLANAQYEWLAAEGAAQGWQPVSNASDAQRLANQGWFVVAAYENRNDEKPGHIAIVRPSDKSEQSIRTEGPQVTQAGSTNYRSVSLREGFAGHPAAWARQEVRFFSHAVGSDRPPEARR